METSTDSVSSPTLATAEPAVDPGPQPNAGAAMDAARRLGVAVEDLSQRSATAQVFAQPGGTWQARIASEPVRIQGSDGSWEPVDPTLVRNAAGEWVPRASTAGVSFSDGGAGAFVSMQVGGESSFALAWPEPLPEPVVEGSTLTYRDAVPDGDLVVEALPGGFSHSIVLYRAPDGPVDYPIPLQLDGVSLVEEAGGALSVRTAAGKQVVSAPEPLMWDGTTTTAGDPREVTSLATTVDGTGADAALTLTPDLAMLQDPATQYPVTLDPTFTKNPFRDTWVQNPGFTDSQVGSTELRAGTYDGGGHKARSFVDFNTDDLLGKQIVSATLKLRNFDSHSCNSARIRVHAISQGWDKNTLTWGNQPDFHTGVYDDFTAAFGGPTCTTGGWASWNVKPILERWADPDPNTGWTNHGFRVAAVDETNSASWRRYRSANHTDTTTRPDLIVEYNTTPAFDGTSFALTPCTGTCSPAVTDTTTPTLSAKASDADLDTLDYTFAVRKVGDTTNLAASGTVNDLAQNTAATWTVPSGQALQDLTDYQYRVQAADTDSSVWSSWRTFTVDIDQPPSTPQDLAVSPCVGVCADAVTDSLTPNLSAVATDADTDQLTYQFQVRPAAQTETVAEDSVPSVNEGITANWRVPDGVLVNDTSYQFRVGAQDAKITSWSDWKTFAVDLEGNQNGPTWVARGGETKLSADQTWGPLGSPYVIDGSVSVPVGKTLTLLPGTVVKFFPQTERTTNPSPFNWSGLNVEGGQLVADGTTANPIVFTSYHDDTVGGNTNGVGRAPAPGDWTSVRFGGSSTAVNDTPVSLMDNASVRYGGEGTATSCGGGATEVTGGGRLRITSSEFEFSEHAGVVLSHMTPRVSMASVSNSRFAQSACGLGVWAAPGDAFKNVFENSLGKGVYMNGASGVRFYGNWAYSSVEVGESDGVLRTEADLRGNALLGGVVNEPAGQDLQDASYNWWGSNPPKPGECFDSNRTYIPAITWGGTNDPNCPPYGWTITGYFTKVTPMLASAPPLPEAGLGADPYQFNTVPAAQTLGNTGTGSEFAYRPTGVQADPVNSATGSYVDQVTDASVASVGAPLTASRTYNSADTSSGSLGRGWSFGYDLRLAFPTSDRVVFVAGDGQRVGFTRQGDGTWLGDPGVTATLTDKVGGGHALTTRAQLVYAFDAAGRVQSILDRNNQGVTFGYDTSGRLATASSVGRTLTFTYDPSGLLQRVDLPDARYVEYGYTNGALTSVRDLAGNTTSYGYDTTGRLTSETNPLLTTVMRLAYDPATGRVSDQWDALNKHTTFAWDPAEQVATMTDPRGGTWVDDYANNVLIDRTDPLGRTTHYEYDNALQLIAVTNPRGVRHTFSYDDAGNMVATTGPLGTVSTTYNALHDPVSTVNAKGTKTQFGYTNGNLTSLTTTPADPADGPPLVENYTVNALGLVKTATDAAQKVTTYGYDANGDLKSVTTPGGRTISHTYDTTGRMKTSVEPRGNLPGADPALFTTTYTYTPLDQIDTLSNPLGHVVDHDYDDAGRLERVTDPKDRITHYDYDDAGHVLSVQGPDPTIAATTATYDDNGNLKTSTDASGRTISYGYDLANQPTAATGPLGTYTLGYDRSGNLASIKNPEQQTTTLTYNAANLLTGINYPDATSDVTYEYDVHGNRKTMRDGAGTVTYTYDTLDRLRKVTRGTNEFSYDYNNLGRITATTNPLGRSFGYDYDADGLLKTVTDTANSTVLASYTYTPTGAPETGTLADGSVWTRRYDRAGRLERLTDTAPGGTVLLDDTYTFDPVGNPTQITHADNTTDTYTYDLLDRLTAVCYNTTSCDGATDYVRWSYDGVGNRKSETRPAGATTYDYDQATGLLQTVTKPGGASTTYTHDRLGRMKTAGATTYNYNLADRLTSQTSGGVTTTHTYDGDGRRLKATSGGATTNFWWDPRSYQLAGETDTNNSTIRSYAYGLGRIATTNSAGVNSYLHTDAQGSVRTITDPTGAVDWRREYEPYGVLRSSQHVDPTAAAHPIGFAGEYTDTSGASHLRARQYDPTLGAFTTPDPAGAVSWSGTTTYANANPMAFSDPYGLFGMPSFGAVVDVVNDWGPEVTTVLGVGSLFIPPLAPFAAGAAGLTAAASAYTAYDTCTNGAKGACSGAILDGAINTAMAIPGAALGRPAVRAGLTRLMGRISPRIGKTTGARTEDEIPGLSSPYKDITKGNSIRNVATDVTPQQFGDNLMANGWKVTTSTSGRGATIYTKDGATYSVYGQSASTGGPTAQFIPRGATSPTLKIRLGE